MKRLTRALMAVSLALMLAGMGTCYFGQRYVENEIPVRVRAGMEWIERGLNLVMLGVLVGVLAIIVHLIRRLYPR
jgi:cobalamin biosynthesis protein CobD/CbiB